MKDKLKNSLTSFLERSLHVANLSKQKNFYHQLWAFIFLDSLGEKQLHE